MIWTENEITRHYKEAKDKRQAISILAQCNGCYQKNILEILHKNGIIVDLGRKERRGKKSKIFVKEISSGEVMAMSEACYKFGIDYKKFKYAIRGKGRLSFKMCYNGENIVYEFEKIKQEEGEVKNESH